MTYAMVNEARIKDAVATQIKLWVARWSDDFLKLTAGAATGSPSLTSC